MAGAFSFDLNRCTGCHACTLACAIENELEPGTSWRQILSFNEEHRPELPVFHLSLACNHCEHAPCMKSCPALAYARDPRTGAVTIDGDKCIGCKYCSWACPYDAPRYDALQGVMTKCTFCAPRLDEGLEPACVSACPTEALGYGDRDGMAGDRAVTGFPETPAGPSIRFLPLREGARIPEGLHHEAGPDPGEGPGAGRPGSAPSIPRKVHLKSEWPLALFTLIAAILVAGIAAAALGAEAPSPFLFVAVAAAGMALSSMHLGRKSRAWRAVLNLRGSWLSREVLAYGAFVAAGAVVLSFGAGDLRLLMIPVVLGAFLLFCMDRVYDVAADPATMRAHSAGVLLTGIFLAGVFAMDPRVALPAGLTKLALYLVRRSRWFSSPARPRPVFSGVRVLVGLVVPMGVIAFGSGLDRGLIVAAAILGELIDRLEFYADFEPESPARAMRRAERTP